MHAQVDRRLLDRQRQAAEQRHQFASGLFLRWPCETRQTVVANGLVVLNECQPVLDAEFRDWHERQVSAAAGEVRFPEPGGRDEPELRVAR